MYVTPGWASAGRLLPRPLSYLMTPYSVSALTVAL